MSSFFILITFLLVAYAKVIDYGVFKEMDFTSHIMHKYITYKSDNYTTLCWAEIQVTNAFHNGTNSTHNEYAIILLSSTDIPTNYLKHMSIIDNVEYSYDGDTKKSRVFNFTSTNITENGVVTEYSKLLCGSGPVLTKDYIDLNLKKRFEIRVAPAWKMGAFKQFFSSDNGTIPGMPSVENIVKIIKEVPKKEMKQNNSPAQANVNNTDITELFKGIEDEINDFSSSKEDNSTSDEEPILGIEKKKSSAEDDSSFEGSHSNSDEFVDSAENVTSTYHSGETLNTVIEISTTETNIEDNQEDKVFTAIFRNCSSMNCTIDGLNLSLINVQIFNLFNNNVSTKLIEKLSNNSDIISYNHQHFTNGYFLKPFLKNSMIFSNGDVNYTSFLQELLNRSNSCKNESKSCY